jgi:hypothetical protein
MRKGPASQPPSKRHEAAAVADDAFYYDPFFGPALEKGAFRESMAHTEKIAPISGTHFNN